jgi:uncharacterized MAPEG superfamily protein
MTPELQILAYAGLLQGVQYVLMSVSANLDLGLGKTTSARDIHRLGRPLTEMLGVRAGRLHRAFTNHFEGLILFTLAVVVVTLADRATGFSAACAWIYLGARILYVPAYFFGLAPWRSIIWLVGFLATMAMLASALVF